MIKVSSSIYASADRHQSHLSPQLLDSGEVLEEVNQKERPRRKPLPATYEPGAYSLISDG